MEYYINKDANVARKIYELGFKKFSQETAFVFQYIDFLFHRSDENSTYSGDLKMLDANDC